MATKDEKLELATNLEVEADRIDEVLEGSIYADEVRAIAKKILKLK